MSLARSSPGEALLVVSFGGPEGPDEVMPFLESVTRGRGIPEVRLREVAAHYLHFGGVSPIQEASRNLVAALGRELALPVYWGTRHGRPTLEDAMRRMRDDGVRRALAFVTSAFGGHSSCRAYRDDLERARRAVEGAPTIEKLRLFHDHPGFLEAQAARVRDLGAPPGAFLLFTAHSVPLAQAAASAYEAQVRAACAALSASLGAARWELAWQSRSGPPGSAWLEPDVGDALEALGARGEREVVVVPVGFTADHMEVVWDLDHQAKARADRAGVRMLRAPTVGTHPLLLRMVAELVAEHLAHPPPPCAPDCCPAVRPLRPGS